MDTSNGSSGILNAEVAKEVIEREFEAKIRRKLTEAINQGYKLADEHVKKEPFLSSGVFQIQTRGNLRPYAIWYEIKNYCNEGLLPFQCRVVPTRNKSFYYLQIFTDTMELTISAVQSPKNIARPALFRDSNHGLNQLVLDLYGTGDTIVKSLPYKFLLTHGHDGGNEYRPYFINLGLPNEKRWIEKINILDEPYVIEKQDLVPEEKIEDSQNEGPKLVKFIEANHIADKELK
ncbi:hypothetical protein IC619_002840 [Hazenella sp. IB182353]|uniref:hypothetical protein n=1 Tax=Polycladospora coralii TaxID=2771432 RepID=UPI00174719B4|nr:hypothetical protein [Polycladospora coralii]MBS7529433.1 hypothetical protein [Polycladospora coralii]